MFTIRGGYHGDTFARMSVCDPVGGMHAMFTGLLPRQLFAPRPPAGLDAGSDPDGAARSPRCSSRHAGEIAAVIIEPVLQGAGGMHFYSRRGPGPGRPGPRPWGSGDLRRDRDRLRAHGHGLGGRPGCGVAPDILCVGKALTGGYLTLAATLCTAEVAARVDASPAGAMMHGPTFMANPLACAVACASLDLLARHDNVPRIAGIQAALRAGLAPATGLESVRAVRTLGAVGVVQLDRPVDVAAVTRAALDAGVWVRPFRNLVYTMPPYVCTADDLATITAGIVSAVKQVHG